MLKDVFRAALVLRGIYLVCFGWYKSKQMLTMRQRIFALNFAFSRLTNAYAGWKLETRRKCELFF